MQLPEIAFFGFFRGEAGVVDIHQAEAAGDADSGPGIITCGISLGGNGHEAGEPLLLADRLDEHVGGGTGAAGIVVEMVRVVHGFRAGFPDRGVAAVFPDEK